MNTNDMTAEEAAELEQLEKKLAKDIAEKRKEFEIGRKCPKTSSDRMVHVFGLYGTAGTVSYKYGDFGGTWTTIEELQALAEALPPVPSERVRGTYDSVLIVDRPGGAYTHDIRTREEIAPFWFESHGTRMHTYSTLEWFTKIGEEFWCVEVAVPASWGFRVTYITYVSDGETHVKDTKFAVANPGNMLKLSSCGFWTPSTSPKHYRITADKGPTLSEYLGSLANSLKK